jgi:hypothetical protein
VITGAIATFGSVTPVLIFVALGILFEPLDQGLVTSLILSMVIALTAT